MVTLFSGITSVVTTLGTDDSSIPTSKAVADALSEGGFVGELNNISDEDARDLTDGGNTDLHKHSYNSLDGLPAGYTDADALAAWVASGYKTYITEEGIYTGQLTAEQIEALQSIVTPNLYAEKANIAEITVDQLETSNKVERYKTSDTSNMDFIRIRGRDIDFLQGIPLDGYPTEQLTDRLGNPLYWTDETEVASTTEVTDYPVTVYQYTEKTKMRLFYELDDLTGYYVPRMEWGEGYGQADPDRGKGFMHKDENGFVFEFINAEGESASVMIEDFVDATLRRLASCSINRTTGEILVLQEGESAELGDETLITFVEGVSNIVYTWPDGLTTTISIV